MVSLPCLPIYKSLWWLVVSLGYTEQWSFIEPEWASYSLGVFLCFACCGVHRSLGTHISRTKSLTVDNWDDEQVAVGTLLFIQKIFLTTCICSMLNVVFYTNYVTILYILYHCNQSFSFCFSWSCKALVVRKSCCFDLCVCFYVFLVDLWMVWCVTHGLLLLKQTYDFFNRWCVCKTGIVHGLFLGHGWSREWKGSREVSSTCSCKL